MKKVLLCVLAFFLIAGSAWSFSINDHVKVAPGGKGDLLFFPMFYTDGSGLQTKISVINTSPTWSVVAKLVIRGAKTSPELLDFMLYLSPMDMWTGIIRTDNSRGTVIYSEDSSVLNQNYAFASATDPMNYPLYKPCADEANNMGYIEVITTWAKPVSAFVALPSYPLPINLPITNHNIIKAQFDNDRQAVPVVNWTPSSLWGFGAGPAGGTPAAVWAGGQVPPIIGGMRSNYLTGFYELANLANGNAFEHGASEAVALADYFQNTYIVPGPETFLGAGANNNMMEIEAALSKGSISIPYFRNITYFGFTFPTKLFECSNRYPKNASSGPFWNAGAPVPPATSPTGFVARNANVTYLNTAYDMNEANRPGPVNPYSGGPGTPASTLTDEMNIVDSSKFPFDEGWVIFNFAVPAVRIPRALNFTGEQLSYTHSIAGAVPIIPEPVVPIPVIATAGTFINGSISIFKPAYSDGNVWADTDLDATWGRVPYYQYSDYPGVLGD